MEDLKNNRAPLLYSIKHCALFQSHWWIQTGVTVWKCSIRVKISNLFGYMTSKFDGRPSKKFDTTAILHQALCIISKPSVNSNWSYSPEILNAGQNRRFSVSCDLGIWCMTLKNNRAPPLCHFKLCASFHSHMCIQIELTVRKRKNPILWSKSVIFLSRVTLKVECWPWKTIGHLCYATSSFVHHFVALCELKLELQSGNG